MSATHPCRRNVASDLSATETCRPKAVGVLAATETCRPKVARALPATQTCRPNVPDDLAATETHRSARSARCLTTAFPSSALTNRPRTPFRKKITATVQRLPPAVEWMSGDPIP
jgi:hypothetical protein